MSIPSILLAIQGHWSGVARLHLPGDPVRESASQAQLDPVAGGKFLALSYDWTFEREPQGGLLLWVRACVCCPMMGNTGATNVGEWTRAFYDYKHG